MSNDKINVYLPDIVGRGYGNYWRFKGRYRVCKGSRASKKSKTTALNIIYRIMRYPLSNALIIRQVFATLRDSCYADLEWAVKRLKVEHLWQFKTSPLEIVYIPTQQKILFRGLDNANKLASIAVKVGYLCFVWIEEAYEVEDEADFNMIDESIRGHIPLETGLFKQITLTFNPWGIFWVKERFFDKENDTNILAMTTNYLCNEWLDEADKQMFEDMKKNRPERYKVAGLGEWGIDGAQSFEEFRDIKDNYETRLNTHVIKPFEIPRDWKIYRSFDFGYSKPYSVGWYAVDYDGRFYRITELYGCTGKANEGIKSTPTQIAKDIKALENEHPLLKGKDVVGVADPSIWDESRGESICMMMNREGVYWHKADNTRLAGKMQCHYRLEFDNNGIPMFYVFSNCKHFIRTIPILKQDDKKPEDIDTDLEDHIYDEWRYMMMERKITPRPLEKMDNDEIRKRLEDPLNMYADEMNKKYDKYNFFRI